MPPTSIQVLRAALERQAADVPGAGDAEGMAFAAVAAILRPVSVAGVDDTEVLFIRRAEHAGDPWSGHMAFPGGRRDPGDQDLLATAKRETREEIGLHLDGTAELLGPLRPIPAVARGKRMGLTVAPFVFLLREPSELTLNHEVAEAVWAPLGPMVRGNVTTQHAYEWQGQTLKLPAYDVDGRVVWGLTYQMLQTLFALVA